MNNKLDLFKEKIQYILSKLNIDVNYIITETENEKDFLFVMKNNDIYTFCVNFKKIDINQIDIFLYHEIYHIKQYLNNFPTMLMNEKSKQLDFIQKLITDLYVTDELIKDGFFELAYGLFIYRLNSVSKKILESKIEKNTESEFRLSYLLAEKTLFFDDLGDECLNKVEIVKNFLNSNTLELKIIKLYENSSINEMYVELLKTVNSSISIMNFDNYILIT